jgi:creatinine amidohydrolase
MTERPEMPGFFLPATTTVDSDIVRAAVAVLPVGAFEQHGPYLPLVTDTLIAIAITEAISQHHKVFQLPALSFGCSHNSQRSLERSASAQPPGRRGDRHQHIPCTTRY